MYIYTCMYMYVPRFVGGVIRRRRLEHILATIIPVDSAFRINSDALQGRLCVCVCVYEMIHVHNAYIRIHPHKGRKGAVVCEVLCVWGCTLHT